jgi:hypothetical protein
MSDKQTRPWWQETELLTAAQSAWSEVKALDAVYRTRASLDRLNQAIYLNRQLTSSGRYAGALEALRTIGYSTKRLNVTKAKGKTLMNKIAKHPSAIRVNPDGACYDNKAKAQKLQQVLMSKLKSTACQKLNQTAFRDGMIVGNAVVKGVCEFGDVRLERVRRREILVDPREGRDGKPRTIHHLTLAPREVLREIYGKDKLAQLSLDQAKTAPRSLEDETLGYGTSLGSADLIQVCESHHLGAGPEEKGVVMVHTEAGPLRRSPWPFPRFPYAFFLWEDRYDEFWSPSSFVDEMKPIQLQINETVADIQAALYYGGNPVLLEREGSSVNVADFASRRRLPKVTWSGSAPPQIVSFNPVAQQKVDFLQFLLRQADEISGVSMMAQAARNPLGANASGAALQEFEDREDERHWDLDFGLSLMWKDCGDILIDLSKLAAEDPQSKVSVSWSEGSLLRRIDWNKVDMDRDQFELQLEPANFLPDTRAGKLAASERLMQAGLIQGPSAAALFDFPDLRQEMSDLTASRDAILRWLERVDELSGPVPSVDPQLDLELAFKAAVTRYRRAYAEEAKPEVLERYRAAIRTVLNAQQKRDADKPAPMPPGPMGPPPGLGGPPMPSEPSLLPPGAPPIALPGQGLPGAGPL